MLPVRVDAVLPQGIAIGSHGAVFIQTAKPRIRPHNAAVEHTTGKFRKALRLQCLQVAQAYPRGRGDFIERNAAPLPFCL